MPCCTSVEQEASGYSEKKKKTKYELKIKKHEKEVYIAFGCTPRLCGSDEGAS